MIEVTGVLLPSWKEFTEKVSKCEQYVNDKIGEFKNNHPLLHEAINKAIRFLPPPFDVIADEIYNSFEGSAEDKSVEVLDYLNSIQNKGEEHYNKIASQLNNILSEVSDIKQITAKESTLQNIKEILISGEKEINEKLEILRNEVVPSLQRLEKGQEKILKNQERMFEMLEAGGVREDNAFSLVARVHDANVNSAITMIRDKRLEPEKHDYRIFNDVKEFWEADEGQELEKGMWVQIDGTFSEYGPLTFGTPRDKKQDHFNWRGSISNIDIPLGIDGIMSISSGNAVIRLEPVPIYTSEGSEPSCNRYAGLYQGIGRNSIPVVIDEKLLRESTKRDNIPDWKHTYDVRITGTVEKPPGCFSTTTTNSATFDKQPYVLQVAGEGSSIRYLGETRFFEADVWAIFESKGVETMIVRCPDFSERTSIMEAVNEIRKQVKRQFGAGFVVKEQYDSILRPFGPDVGKYAGLNIEDARGIVQMARQIYEIIR